ncbi:MAG: CDP-diacylglycerol--serine O-phosphatidyltransferase [Candidatus Adiutrix sp.]|nr:CDP-diacylglycerol--serine O-phosphatidyltransferase [Candidatus Adiutrix sp.]
MTSLKSKNRTTKRRSIYILPNIFTTLSLFFGFYSILAAIDGRYSYAAWFIVISALCDGLDGTVARMTNTTSRFGVEYDSLCDLVAFGAAPAVLVYLWALTPDALVALGPQYQRLGAAAAFIFLACGALRLARFNVFSEARDPGFFQGLPIPGGALMVASAVLWHYRHGPVVEPNGPLVLGLILTLAFLMVSSIDYVSHKHKVLFRNRRPFETLVAAVLVMGLIIAKNKSAFLPAGFAYLISGPVVTAARIRRRRREDRRSERQAGHPAAGLKPEEKDAP